MSFKAHVLFAIVALQLTTLVAAEPNIISFGDFMEFNVGVFKACENATGAPNTTFEIVRDFERCTFELSPTPPKDAMESYEQICKSRAKYFACWDKLKTDVLAKCGKDKEAVLPAVYRATVAAYCGNDNGAKRSAELRKALSEAREEDMQNCPEETGIHWLENCKTLIETFNSPDLCARHGAITKCIGKITCDNIKIATVYRQIYSDGKPFLQCNERRA